MKNPGKSIESDAERLDMLLAALRLNAESLAASIGKGRGDIISNILRKKNGISRNLVSLITGAHPRVNPLWLWDGSGDMFVTGSGSGASGEGCLNCADKDRIIRQYREIRDETVEFYKSALAEKDKTIALLNDIIRGYQSREKN